MVDSSDKEGRATIILKKIPVSGTRPGTHAGLVRSYINYEATNIKYLHMTESIKYLNG